MTRRKTIYDIKGMLRGGSGGIVDDDTLPDRQVALWVSSVLGLLIRREQNEGKPINPVTVQHICLDVKLVDESECPDCFNSGCFIYKSTKVVPKALMSNSGLLITRVGLPIMSKQGFSYADWGRFPYIKDKYDQNWYSIKDNYIYIKSKDYLKCILVSLIPEDIEDLAEYSDVLGNPCLSDEMQSNVPMHLYEELCSIIIKNRGSIILGTAPDLSGDASHTIQSMNGKVRRN